MIPVGDSVRSRSFPYVNLTLIAIAVIVFLYELNLSTISADPFGLLPISKLDLFFFEWGVLPACLTDTFGLDHNLDRRVITAACPDQGQALLTPFTSLFIHGGFLHLIGNMIFLWVFGDNVEDALGHRRYAIFYLVIGLVATATHVALNQSDLVPVIGASGAIAGVLGAYLVLYPRATVTAILPIFLLIWLPLRVPAILLIGFWFVLQIFNGVAALAARDVIGAGGVAWFAHIGGFVAGLLLLKLFMVGRPRPAAPRRGRLSRVW